MEYFKREQEKLLRKIANSFANFRKEGKVKMTRGACEVRLENLGECWQKLNREHSAMIRSKGVDFDDDYFKGDFLDTAEEVYLNQKGEFKEFLNLLPHASDVKNTSDNAQARPGESGLGAQLANLPRVDLPKFSGAFNDWIPFKELFDSMIIQDQTIAAVTKLHYLRSCVNGEAADYINSIPIAGDNFHLAWQTLLNTYENKRRQVNSHIDSLFAISPAKNETSAELKRILTSTLNSIRPLEMLRLPAEQRDDFLVHLTTSKLNQQIRRDWENHLGNSNSPKEPPKLETLIHFLEGTVVSLESYERSSRATSGSFKQFQAIAKMKFKSNSNPLKVFHADCTNNRDGDKCALCKQSHFIMNCDTVRSKSPSQRKDIVKSLSLCFNCLSRHLLKSCRSQKRCRFCHARHHSLLHEERNFSNDSGTPGKEEFSRRPSPCSSTDVTTIPSVIAQETTTSMHSASPTTYRQTVLLATVLVKVIGPTGNHILARALVDQCAQSSFISQSLCQRLRLKGRSTVHKVMGLNGCNQAVSKKAVSFIIKPYFESTFSSLVDAYVIGKVSSYTPATNIIYSKWEHLRGLTLADPEFHEAKEIDLLLSAAVHARIMESQIKKGKPGEPIAMLTSLGWMLSGDAKTRSYVNATSTAHHCQDEDNLNELLTRFWKQEDLQVAKAILTPDEQECEDFFLSTYRRQISGRFIVRLPLKDGKTAETIQLGSSFLPALRMQQKMERKFIQDRRLKEEYQAFIQGYIDLGHMEVTEGKTKETERCLHLPHHGVWKESSTTTRLRVVFNGSQQTDRGVSLNSKLHIGANLLPDLGDVVVRWRSYRFAFTADIEKMFRQILVDERDQHLQNILWRFDFNDPVLSYRLQTLTYGLACSPYLAIRCIKQLAKEEGHAFFHAVPVLLEEMYMDDVLSGAHTLSEAHCKQEDLIQLLMVGGFPLRKWASNTRELLEWLPREDVAASSDHSLTESSSMVVLGLSWLPQEDSFYYRISIESLSCDLTKRSVLSNISKLFDPLGWLSPVVVTAKIFMQSLWLLKLDWDTKLPVKESVFWNNWYYSLPVLSQLRIPRWIHYSLDAKIIEIHVFADASKRAFGAAVYLRIVTAQSCTSTLISSKSKVAPIKTVSIPRLELCAALLAARSAKHFSNILNLTHTPVHIWSDSLDVLYWLRGHPSRWQTFVANRCSEILNILPDAMWHHIPSAENPADAVSRGITPSELLKSELWWKGPPRLTASDKPWPASESLLQIPEEQLEVRNVAHISTVTKPAVWDLIDKYSSLHKLLRVSVFCFRFLRRKFHSQIMNGTILNFLRKFPISNCPHATPDEIDHACLVWIHFVQKTYFSQEMSLLLKNKKLPNRSPLVKLSAIFDGLCIRVGGRLKHSLLSEDEKHPIILPASSRLTTLIIEHNHRVALHGGIQLTLTTARRKYWVIGGRKAVKRVIHNCLICRRYSASPVYQKMGNLPDVRVRMNRPFRISGVDYAGPFQIKVSPGRGSRIYKGYVALFICMCTKAVHLEAVSSYESISFIAAFKRFTARRGHCATLYSDRGSNFVGADIELRRLFEKSSKNCKEIVQNLANVGTNWCFNPPAAPHFGGIWEAAVKSTKYHLRRVLGTHTLTFEEFSTLLSQVEACLNSRPLIPITDDIADLQPLTPAHFLIGSSSLLLPEPRVTEESLPPLKRWLLITQMVQHFWDRWSAEYLQNLQRRSKWANESPSLAIGDVVLIRNELTAPAKWPLARIIDLHKGTDGLARVATLPPIATLDPISNNGLRNIPKNSCHVNGEVFEDGDQVIMTRADLNGEMDPCESCLCVRGEVFCWWGGCPPRHTYPPPTPRPLPGHQSSISPPSSTSSPPDAAGAGGGAFGERPTLSPPLPPADDPSSNSARSSSLETSTPEYPEDEEEEEAGESPPLGLGRRREGTKSESMMGKGEESSFLGSLAAKPGEPGIGGSKKEGFKRVGDDDFEGDMGVEGLEKNPPEGTSELVDAVSETGDLDKQSRQQQSPSLDMFDVDAF